MTAVNQRVNLCSPELYKRSLRDYINLHVDVRHDDFTSPKSSVVFTNIIELCITLLM